jgi:hypothetical protein
VLRRHNFPLRLAYVYNNTVYTTERGISLQTAALDDDAVVGNLVFGSAQGITGSILHSSDNLVVPVASASTYVNSPSFELATMDFYPRKGKCQGKAIDLRQFKADADFKHDFNGAPKVQGKAGVTFRGAYAGSGPNPGWQLQAAIKSSGKLSPEPIRQSEPAPARNENDHQSQYIIRPLRLDFGTAYATADHSPASAFCLGGCTVQRLDNLCPRSTDSYAPGLLFRKATAGAEPTSTERRHCASVPRSGG